jgi:hypothetical protein
MKRKLSKKFTVISISLLVLALAGIGFACGWDGYIDEGYNSFFAPEVSNNEDATPFFRSQYSFYGNIRIDNNVSNFDTTNIDEWSSLLKGVKKNDLKYILYQSRLGEIDSMIFFLKSSTYAIKPYLKKNSLLLFADKAISREFLYYVGFARRCEPYTTYAPDWWDNSDNNPKNDKASIQKLIDGGKKQLTNVKTDFIKDRYTYQIIRLYYNIEDYETCAKYYEENANKLLVKNTIPYRAMGYAAGAYYKMGNYSTANYYYALCYDLCPELKYSSFLSFHPQEEEDWTESLNKATTSRQKQVLWHMLGIYADPLRAMKEIYALDPKSDLLDLLLTRAVNIEEEQLSPETKLKEFKINKELFSFVKTVADNKNTLKPYLWYLVSAYFNTVAGDFKKAESYLAKTQAYAKTDELLADQIHLIKMMAKIDQYKPSAQQEAEIQKELSWIGKYSGKTSLRASFMYDWSLKQLSMKYFAMGDSIKGTLLLRQATPQFYNNQQNWKLMVDFMNKNNKSAFDEYLLEIYPVNLDEVVCYQAVNLFYNGKQNEAKTLLNIYPYSGDANLPADPFLIHINDCHDCDHEAGTSNPYSIKSLMEKMIEMEEQLKNSPKDAANIYFQLANAYYNITYYGNSRTFYYSLIGGLERGEWTFSNPIYNCTKAIQYYQKAMELSSSNEFKAKCCFMASKCEQNNLYMNWPENYNGDFKSGSYFRLLKDKFSKTKYYQEIIKECGYFRTYVSAM